MSAEDRLQLLLNQSALTGIDFVYVYASQDRLDVFFLRAPETLDVPLPGSLPRSAVRIENVRDANVPDASLRRYRGRWSTDARSCGSMSCGPPRSRRTA